MNPSPPSSADVNGDLNALVGMGFDRAKAKEALACTDGDLCDVVDYLLAEGLAAVEKNSDAGKKPTAVLSDTEMERAKNDPKRTGCKGTPTALLEEQRTG